MTSPTDSLRVRDLGVAEYTGVWEAMQRFTASRGPDTIDELWLVEHPPVYTLGRAGDAAHVLSAGDIPVVRVDRGGQVTYHGPGQLVAYTLLDLARRGLGVRHLVDALEQGVIALLADYGVEARARRDAPGVYVGDAKVASLGLRVRRGRSYHGLALNVDMDLAPFAGINPCGHAGLQVTQLGDVCAERDLARVAGRLVAKLAARLHYRELQYGDAPASERDARPAAAAQEIRI